MGTKHTRKWQYFFLHLACLGILPFIIFGCLHFSNKLQGQQLLDEGMNQMLNRQYEASLATTLTVLHEFPNSLADQALFQIGVLHASPENPNQDFEKSLDSFTKILSAFPESRLRHQAQLGVLFVKDMIDKDRKTGKLNRKNIALKRMVEQQKNEIAILQQKTDSRENIDLIAALEKTVEKQKKEIDQLLEQIEKLKRVDLGIEEKKQKIMQQNENIEEKSNGKDSGS